ncbi:RebB family R body protein [Vibrio sp.]|uniref:RebB family R body protein n=1 Tax=Vibrio sp. TaxID=678 RepID=UPI0037AC5115
MSNSVVSAGMTEAALAETLSRTMHNAVQNQHQSQMTTQASITNVMSQILVSGRRNSVAAPNLSELPTESNGSEVESIVADAGEVEESTADSLTNKIFGTRS